MEPSLLVLFLSAFLAATILPASSEIVIGAIVAGDAANLWPAVGVATAGNTLGAVANWLLGRYFAHYADRPWFPLKPDQHERAVRWFGRYGLWGLLFAWLPIVGDPYTVVAGLFRVPFWKFVILVAVGKGARYLALALAVLGVIG